MKTTAIVILFVMMNGALTVMAAIDIAKLPAASKQQDVTFDKDIKPILKASCVRCHSAQEHQGGVQLDTLENVLKGGKGGKIVEAGQSAQSQIVIAASQLDPESAMPPLPKPGRIRRTPRGSDVSQGTNAPVAEIHNGTVTSQITNAPAENPAQRPRRTPLKPLTPEQVGLIRAWIDQGAK